MYKVYARHTVNLDICAYGKYFSKWREGTLAEGDDVFAFEKAFGKSVGAESCVAVGSARAGFYLTLKAMGIGPGGEVIMPAYTFPSMPAAVVAAGATPVFVDVDPETFNIDPALAATAVTKRTAAVVVAHLFGRAAAMEPLVELAEANDLYLIEDCAHAAGAASGGKCVGSFGDAAVFSFGIGKNMPCFGGGAVTFTDRELAGKVRKLVNSTGVPYGFGLHKRILSTIPSWLLTRSNIFPWTLYVAARVFSSLGSDAMDRSVEEPVEKTSVFSLRSLSRMANIQAAVGLDQLAKLSERNEKLAENGRLLAEKLSDVPTIKAPEPLGDGRHIYLYFRVLVPEAARFRALLLKRGIDTQRDDMCDCSSLDAFKDFATKCPVAAALPDQSIELPNNPSLSERDIDYIATSVREVAEIVSTSAGTGAAG